METVAPQTVKEDWLAQRAWCLSGNKILMTGSARPATSLARQIYLPESAEEIASLVKSLPATTPVACVCGGHESSNAALFASRGAVVFDLARLKAIDFHRDSEGLLVTVGAGVVFRELVEALRDQQGALPVGTGPGVGVVGWTYGQSGVVATVDLEQPHNGVAHEHFLPSGPFAILPLTENRASLVWTESDRSAKALMAASPQAFQSYLDRRFGDYVGAATAQEGRFIYPLALELAERMTAPRLALIGDAAHGVHPIAGQGLNLGLKDVAALAEVLVDAVRLGEDLGSPVVLERYARWRRFDNVMLAAATDGFTRLFSTDNPLVRLARGAGMGVVNAVGPARRFFMQEAGGAVGDLPRLLRGEAL